MAKLRPNKPFVRRWNHNPPSVSVPYPLKSPQKGRLETYSLSKLETDKRISKPRMAPKDISEHTTESIEGIENATVIRYMDDMNANDFDALIELFAPDGAMQPPFQKPIIGKDAILQFFREDCKNLKVVPERGVEEAVEEGLKQIRVTGKVYSPWLGAWVNVAWRFSLNLEGQISLVAIEVLASPKELLKFIR